MRHICLLLLFIFTLSGILSQSPVNDHLIDNISFEVVFDPSSFHITCKSYYRSGPDTVHFREYDTENYFFYWRFGDGNTGELPVTGHQYEKPGNYPVSLTVTSKDDPGREFFTIMDIEVNNVLEVPNVFTPDGDLINDIFIVRADGVTPLSITIFDRSGNVVFNQTSPVINWDGRTPGGVRVNPGVYYYVITSSVEQYNKNGFVHIFYGK